MLEIDDKIVSSDILSVKFCCDTTACRGQCCVEGSSGAPLDESEGTELADNFAAYRQYMKPEGVEVIERDGFTVVDYDGDLTTPLINDAECAYSIRENGGTWCAIEKAWVAGESKFRKPISCHLYPIRLVKLANGSIGLQYHRWAVCHAAEVLGAKHGVPLYVSLKDALIRRFGTDFYEQLLDAVEYIKQENELHIKSNS
ncbi:MAG: DUF3109 family protein [Mucinivorans sp.]